MATRAVISDALIIRACNKPGGSGGVYKWIEAATRDTMRYAVQGSPTGKAGNYGSAWHLERGSTPGTYKRSFRMDRSGSNGHWLRRRVANTAHHAGVVEKGRRKGNRWERFTWTEYPDINLIAIQGTSSRAGLHVLEKAFLRAMAKKRRTFISGRIG